MLSFIYSFRALSEIATTNDNLKFFKLHILTYIQRHGLKYHMSTNPPMKFIHKSPKYSFITLIIMHTDDLQTNKKLSNFFSIKNNPDSIVLGNLSPDDFLLN